MNKCRAISVAIIAVITLFVYRAATTDRLDEHDLFDYAISILATRPLRSLTYAAVYAIPPLGSPFLSFPSLPSLQICCWNHID
jgi:hypothetical protein